MNKLCSIEECNKKHASKGYCWTHYGRWKRNGDPLIVVKEIKKRDPVCSVGGCEEKHRSMGLCSFHYNRSEYRKKNYTKYNRSKKGKQTNRKYKKSTVCKDSWIKQRYGIGLGEYNDIFNGQGSSCAICESKYSGRKNSGFVVDHCHKTQVVRGILCHPCNAAIGLFKDKIVNLNKAINYLEKYDG